MSDANVDYQGIEVIGKRTTHTVYSNQARIEAIGKTSVHNSLVDAFSIETIAKTTTHDVFLERQQIQVIGKKYKADVERFTIEATGKASSTLENYVEEFKAEVIGVPEHVVATERMVIQIIGKS